MTESPNARISRAPPRQRIPEGQTEASGGLGVVQTATARARIWSPLLPGLLGVGLHLGT